MTDRIFQYDDRWLQSCATSNLAKFITQCDVDSNHYDHKDIYEQQPHVIINSSSITTMMDDREKCCKLLFWKYMEHYHRQHSDLDISIIRNTTVTSNTGSATYKVGRIIRNFIRNVITIHHHNSQPERRSHRLRLNQFSDQNLQQMFSMNNEPTTTNNNSNQNHAITSNKSGHSPKSRRLHQASTDVLHQSIASMNVPLVHLSSYDEIQMFGMERYSLENVADDGQRHEFVKQIKQYTKHKTDHIQFDLYPSKLRLPTDDMISANDHDDEHQNISTPADTNQFYKSVEKGDMDGSLVYIGRNKKQSLAQKEHDIFATSINWATANNPDGVPIVNDPIDQVTTYEHVMYHCLYSSC